MTSRGERIKQQKDVLDFSKTLFLERHKKIKLQHAWRNIKENNG